MHNNKSFFSKFSPKANFFLGLGTSLVLITIVGFFVLLGMLLKSDSSPKLAGVSDAKPTIPTVQQPGQPNAGSIQLAAVTQDDYIKGNRDAKVSIVEFSDTECPFCKRFHPTMQRIIDEYDGQVNWVYRHFPLTSIHPKAPKEAEAVECAGELGGNEVFWAYLDRLFEITPANNGLEVSQLPEIAEYVGLDRSRFEQCLNSGKYTKKVSEQAQQAQAAGGRGTPYSVIVVDGEPVAPISGALPYEQVKSMIDSVL